MLNNKYLLILAYFIFYITCQSSQSTETSDKNFFNANNSEYQKDIVLRNHKLSEKELSENKSLELMPSEIIISIAHHLRGKDFQNLALASCQLRSILHNYLPFFIPQEENIVVDVIKQTPIDEIDLLAEKWFRQSRIKFFDKLRKIAEQNSKYINILGSTSCPVTDMLDQVQLYIKIYRILAYLGSTSAKEQLEMIKDTNMLNLWTRVNQEELGDDKEGARFSLIKAAMVSDKVLKILPSDYLTLLKINWAAELLTYKPYGIWIPYEIPLDMQIK